MEYADIYPWYTQWKLHNTNASDIFHIQIDSLKFSIFN